MAQAIAGHGAMPGAQAHYEPSGILSWISTVDHKRIGVMYGLTALFFFLIGGIEALLIRIQLARPDNGFLDTDQYKRIFTMTGTTLILLIVLPLCVACLNFFS